MTEKKMKDVHTISFGKGIECTLEIKIYTQWNSITPSRTADYVNRRLNELQK